MRPNRLQACLGLALGVLLLSTACSPDPRGEDGPGADVTTSATGSPEEDHDDGASPPAAASPSASSPSSPSADPTREPEEPAQAPQGETQTVSLDGLAFDLPADWEELDRTNSTTVRADGTSPDVHRVWRATMPDAPNQAVAVVEYREDRQQVDESVSVADRTARIREWAGSTVTSLAEAGPRRVGASLELNGLGCREGSVQMTGAPQLADVGEDGVGQAIRMDYRCTAFTDPRLGEVVGHRWVTTGVDGRRRDVYVTAYTGWLKAIGEPELTRWIVQSVRPE